MTPDRSSPCIAVGVALRDDDAAPLALARELAGFTGAPLALVHIYPYEPAPRLPSPEYERALRDDALAGLAKAAEPLAAECDVTVHALGCHSIVRGLHDAAQSLDASQLVVGSTHRGPLLRVMPGGIGERLLHAAPCAVAIAPRGFAAGDAAVRRIGVAFVDSPEGHDALEAGAAMAAFGDAELSVHTVIAPPSAGPGSATPGWVPPAPFDAEAWIEEGERTIRAQLPDGIAADVVVELGDPCERLAAASERLDLLICGSRGYGPFRAVLLGSVSGRLAHTAACPLIVLPRAGDRAPAGHAAG